MRSNQPGKAALTLTLLIGAVPAALAAGPDWQTVAFDEDTTVDVDVESIRIREGRLTAWSRFSFESEQTIDGMKYRSYVGLVVFDCAAERSGAADDTLYSLPLGSGDVLFTDSREISDTKTTYNRPGTFAYRLLKFVCTYTDKQDAVDA
jgi:hypothetical protein